MTALKINKQFTHANRGIAISVALVSESPLTYQFTIRESGRNAGRMRRRTYVFRGGLIHGFTGNDALIRKVFSFVQRRIERGQSVPLRLPDDWVEQAR